MLEDLSYSTLETGLLVIDSPFDASYEKCRQGQRSISDVTLRVSQVNKRANCQAWWQSCYMNQYGHVMGCHCLNAWHPLFRPINSRVLNMLKWNDALLKNVLLKPRINVVENQESTLLQAVSCCQINVMGCHCLNAWHPLFRPINSRVLNMLKWNDALLKNVLLKPRINVVENQESTLLQAVSCCQIKRVESAHVDGIFLPIVIPNLYFLNVLAGAKLLSNYLKETMFLIQK